MSDIKIVTANLSLLKNSLYVIKFVVRDQSTNFPYLEMKFHFFYFCFLWLLFNKLKTIFYVMVNNAVDEYFHF